MLIELNKPKGTCRCPCDGHANGDRHPSGVYDTQAQTFTCLTTGRSWDLVPEGKRWRLEEIP